MDKLSALLRPQFLVYVLGGVLSAAIDIGTMQMLLSRGLAPVAAASGGFLAGLLVNYAFHAKVTFGGRASAGSALRYGCVVAANYLLTIGIVALTDWMLHSALAGKLISLPVVAVNGYMLGKFWIFRQPA
ncbi:GtrA family protein [Duganella ginsengisoli]|uniref:GtrA family protein n=2 Tax=Pseudoduganella ginsengisoli TaxID=1462440 RepID=A0A6L6PU92_9BURK|nr:GtrA family protein [Pseudoduganella ginsengisoli]